MNNGQGEDYDGLIGQFKVAEAAAQEENQDGGDNLLEGGDNPPPPLDSTPPPAQTVIAASTPNDDAPKTTPTPKEILEVDGTWDEIKATLSETASLRERIAIAEGQPKAAFANEKIAGYNEFVKKHPQIEDFGFYQKVTSLTNEDPIKVLSTQYILKNPEFIGKEELVSKMLEKEYKVDTTLYEADEVEFNKMKLEAAAKVAFGEIDGLRQSYKVTSAPTSEDLGKREAGWKSELTKNLSGFEKLPVPIMNAQTGKPELLFDYDVPKSFVDEFTDFASKAYAKTGDFSEAGMARVKADFIKEVLYRDFANVSHAIVTQTTARVRAEVEAEYEGSTKLRSDNKAPAGVGGEPDVYKTLFD